MRIAAIALLIVGSWALAASALASPPERLAHQGRLTDADGPVSATLQLRFGIWDAAEDGTEVWGEPQSVDVEDGYYAVLLGGTTAGLGALFREGGDLWLQVTVDGEALLPRQRLASVPWALSAGSVSGGSVDASEVLIDGLPVIDVDGTWLGGQGSLDWSQLGGLPGGFSDGVDEDTLGGLSCLDGDRAVWDATASLWVCGSQLVGLERIDASTGNEGDVLTIAGGQAGWEAPAGTSGCSLSPLSATVSMLTCGAVSIRVPVVPEFVSLSGDPSAQLGMCGVTSGGAGVCWGAVAGPTPPGLLGSIDRGSGSACGVRTDGTLTCAGAPDLLPVPAGQYTSVEVGNDAALAIAASGAVVAWGDPNTLASAGLTGGQSGSFQRIRTNWSLYGRTCALTSTGGLQCWGGGSACTYNTPPAGTFLDLDTAGGGFCALATNFSIQCWSSCQGGTSPGGASGSPVVATDFTCAEYRCCGLDGAGTAWCTGGGAPSGLGPYTAIAVANSSDWCAIRATDGAVQCGGVGVQPSPW